MARTSRAMTVKELRVSAKGRWYETREKLVATGFVTVPIRD
jgi:hypothetical protein